MNKKKSPTATNLGIRILIGGYLLYLAYSLIPSIQKNVGTNEVIFWIAVVAIFTVVGGLSIVFSIKAFIKGEYDKGQEEEE